MLQVIVCARTKFHTLYFRIDIVIDISNAIRQRVGKRIYTSKSIFLRIPSARSVFRMFNLIVQIL